MTPMELEAAMCGMAMSNPKYLAEAVSAGVKPEHFIGVFHGQVFDACVKAWEGDKPTDLVTLTHSLGQEKTQELMLLRSKAPLTQNFAAYSKAVLDAWRQRELHSRLVDISRMLTARRPMDPLDPIVERLGDLLMLSKGSDAALRTTTVHDALDRAIAQAEERVGRQGIPGVPTGFEMLDQAFYGFQPGFVYVLGARTAVGKTTMATTMAVNAAVEGHKVAVVTVEMSDTDLVDKMLTRLSRVSAERYLSGVMADEELDRLMAGAKKLASLPLLFTEVAKPSFDLLALEIMRLVRVEGVKLVIIDYLQLFETGDNKFNRNAREDAKLVSARLKGIARSLKVPILVLSQLNRQAPEDGEPELIHIAETDQIARDADVVMLLYRSQDEYFLSIAKHRRGIKGTIRLKANLHWNSFEQGGRVGG